MVPLCSMWAGLAVMCLAATATGQETRDTCRLPPVAGPCEAAMPRFYFDPAQQKCRCFTYGGCGGNANNYETLAECVQSCGGLQSRCLLPKKVGRCKARKTRFYFNSQAGQCQRFYYGGCGANSNNFRSLAACRRSCPDECDSRVPPPPIPTLTCRDNAEPETENGKQVFCGRGGRPCSPGYDCLVDPADRGAICCPVTIPPVLTCPRGEPEKEGDKTVFCGRGGRPCSPGYSCLIHPTDRGAICCPEPKPKCRSDEEYSDCGSHCSERCRPEGEAVACPFMCEQGCFCKAGLMRAQDGSCVPQNQCPAVTCGENEEYSSCGSPCGKRCSDDPNNPKLCMAMCGKGCFCKAGYLRNDQGRCVLKEQCGDTKTCGEHEVYKPCGNRCLNTCFPSYIAVECPDACKPGCMCDEAKGYVRHFHTKKCIPLAQCLKEQKCGMLEEYRTCGSRCWEKCYAPTVDVACPEVCEEGCFCKEGHVRNEQGVCISAKQCVDSFTKCGENEVASPNEACINSCTETCKARTTGARCPRNCGKGCFCARGFGRNGDGKCVPIDQCPSRCGENEVATGCFSACRDTCDFRTGQTVCTMGCNGFGCGCKKGWARDEGGKCVPVDECPKAACKENEVETCSNECAESCKTYLMSGVCTEECTQGCFCKPGFARTVAGDCVPREECKAPSPLACTSAPKVGSRCRKNRPSSRFWYNCQTSRCERFRFKGCGGDKNNYRSLNACVRERKRNQY